MVNNAINYIVALFEMMPQNVQDQIIVTGLTAIIMQSFVTANPDQVEVLCGVASQINEYQSAVEEAEHDEAHIDRFIASVVNRRPGRDLVPLELLMKE